MLPRSQEHHTEAQWDPAHTRGLFQMFSLELMSGILALGKYRKEDHEFEVSLGYIGRSCVKKDNI